MARDPDESDQAVTFLVAYEFQKCKHAAGDPETEDEDQRNRFADADSASLQHHLRFGRVLYSLHCRVTVAADFLKMLIHTYRNSCVQYVIYNRKRTMTNIKSINLMMQRAGYRRVQKVQSQLIATFVIKTSPIWK